LAISRSLGGAALIGAADPGAFQLGGIALCFGASEMIDFDGGELTAGAGFGAGGGGGSGDFFSVAGGGSFSPNDAGIIGEVDGGGGDLGLTVGSGGGSKGKGISRVAFGSDGFCFCTVSLIFSDFGGGSTLSRSGIWRIGGKGGGVGSLVFIGGATGLSFTVSVGGGNGCGWAMARLPSRSLQARTRPNRQISPPRAIHAYWVLRVSILAPLGKSTSNRT
jgi:hypothetical protein